MRIFVAHYIKCVIGFLMKNKNFRIQVLKIIIIIITITISSIINAIYYILFI